MDVQGWMNDISDDFVPVPNLHPHSKEKTHQNAKFAINHLVITPPCDTYTKPTCNLCVTSTPTLTIYQTPTQHRSLSPRSHFRLRTQLV